MLKLQLNSLSATAFAANLQVCGRRTLKLFLSVNSLFLSLSVAVLAQGGGYLEADLLVEGAA
eukprot:5171059-Amphidinium_carterae.1